MLSVTLGSHRVSTIWSLRLALLGLLPLTASAYETGAMSCAEIGQYAARVVDGKEKGITQAQAFTVIEKTVPENSVVERRILTTIVHQIYTAAYAKHLTPFGALASYKAECESQQ